MEYDKTYSLSCAGRPQAERRDPEGSDLKPLVDHAIERARNWDFKAAKDALTRARRQLDD